MTQNLTVGFEIKALSAREFEGYGAIFKNVDLGGDVILPGAFKKSLDAMERLPPMFWMHRPAEVPGKWTKMAEDKKGLFVKGELADTQLGNEVRTLLKMEAVSGLSIGYIPEVTEYSDDGHRLLKEVELVETSIVSLPMNPLARVEAVKTRLSAAGEYVPTPRELENEFRRMGCSKSISRRLVSLIVDEEAGGTLAESQRGSGVRLEPKSRRQAEKEDMAAIESQEVFLMRERMALHRASRNK